MTTSAVPALRRQPEVAAEWEPRLLARTYDASSLPADKKAGSLVGMGMTEKQGGSDVRANTTVAVPAGPGGPGGEYLLTGHKWFTSAPMNDAFLVLAQAAKGLSCFLMPRWAPDGSRNGVHIQRLKDKLGNRSNASAEIELDRAWARMVGEEGRGVATILEMVNVTRLDCVVGSAALMRQAVSQAAHHVAHRRAFGSPLIDMPLMANVVADLEVETQAAEALMVRTAATFDRAASEPGEAALRRVITPVAKYWVTKRCTGVVHESLECLGGNGYVEESIMPRLLRESPLNAIWEGSGNVIALDVLRALRDRPSPTLPRRGRPHSPAPIPPSTTPPPSSLLDPGPRRARGGRPAPGRIDGDRAGRLAAGSPRRPGRRRGVRRHQGRRTGWSPVRHPSGRDRHRRVAAKAVPR